MDQKRLKRKRSPRARMMKFVRSFYGVVTAPLALVFLTHSGQVHPSYGMGWFARIRLGVRFWYNHGKVRTGTSWRASLVMAMKLLEMPPEKKGVVVECGCWKGGTTANLSLVCEIVGRELYVYDSYEGLPEPQENDRVAENVFSKGFLPGIFGGTLDEVTGNVRRYGAIDVCHFKKGWFEESLPRHEGDIVFAYMDVDFCASLHDCLVNLWPHLVERGYIFIDDYRLPEIYSVFFSEKYWDRYFSARPPGLVGCGTGVQVGMFYTDPAVGMGKAAPQFAESTAYCVKGQECFWDYYPDEA
jgi:hypothetical protein